MTSLSASVGIFLAGLTVTLGQILGQYPPIVDVSMLRPIVSTSECGSPTPQTYCVYSTNATASLAPNCNAAVCNGTCPFSSSSPVPFNITANAVLGNGVAAVQGRPGSSTAAFSFAASSVTVPSAIAPLVTSNGFSFAAWIQQNDGNTGVLIYKPAANYSIVASKSSIVFYYLSGYSTGLVGSLSLTPGYWHHITVTAYQQDISFYVNGTFMYAAGLGTSIVDQSGDILIGQGYGAFSSFSGLMQDMYFYSQALPQREVIEVVTGALPFLHLSTTCRCPPSHPADSPTTEGICTQNSGAGMPNRGSVSRINSQSHPAGYINDLTTTNAWISKIGQAGLNITAHLTNSLYEIVFVNFVYGSPRPKAAILETSKDGGKTFSAVQYYADNCMSYFGLPNNGPIVAADSVNCINTTSLQSPTYGVTLRFLMVDSTVRPFSLDTSSALRTFISASDLRIKMVDYFNVFTSPQHLYYSIQEVTVAGRCACNGHASRCGTDITSVCECIHNTTGNKCERCLPLYNDKPWYYGTSSNGYPCKPCTCNNHATSCHYNVTLDPYPTSYDLGGGGICDNCSSFTAGQYCETCIFGYYQPMNATPSDPSPCIPCNCVLAGVTDNGDCVKSQAVAGAIVGQCSCKPNVVGRTCGTCASGFYGLSAGNPNGCSPCVCNTSGSQTLTCDPVTGNCNCKANVGGQNCDQCLPGTAWLNATNPDGCESCQCDPVGSVSTTSCDSATGQCACKPGVGGKRCNQCLPGYFGLSSSGCQSCACSLQGSTSTQCDSVTGACQCKANVGGITCSACVSGFYNFPSCAPCSCNTAGTVNQSLVCDQATGQCPCKSAVTGRPCDTCPSGYTGPISADASGCYPCSCFTPNVNTSAPLCDAATSQCNCLPFATGPTCSTCVSGYYQTPTGCAPCTCNPQGSVSNACNATTGECTCINSGLTGTNCSQCLSGYWGFPSCRPCGCVAGGSLSSVCNSTGSCMCKLYVTGQNCSVCISGFQLFDANNPFGCTAAPKQQAPADLIPLSSSTIALKWLPPEHPNGVILYYIVYRNRTAVTNTSQLAYNDTGLSPSTTYSYTIQAVNVVGQTTSYATSVTTLPGIPQGLATPNVTVLNATLVFASWTPPTQPNGVITRYELVLTRLGGGGGSNSITTVFSGLALSSTVNGLQPFTAYTLLVQACTLGGCGPSNVASFQTLQAAPSFQPPPTLAAVNATAIVVGWVAPPIPNGVVTRYDVIKRGAPFSGNGILVQTVGAAVSTVVVGGLVPFTTYQFSVVSYTLAGSTQSNWTSGATNETVPSGVPSPQVMALSAYSASVTWFNPLTPNGFIVTYNVYIVSRLGRVLLTSSSAPGSYVVQGLQPSTQYSFVEEACTSAGCQSGPASTVTTFDSAPVGQAPPIVLNTTSSSVSLKWDAPLQSNGAITAYILHRRVPSLLPHSWDVGTSFDGTGVAMFTTLSSGQTFLEGFINEVTLQFRTYSHSGTLFYQIDSLLTDFMGVELRGGVPWLVFDVGSGPASIKPNTTETFNDGRWHTVTATQVGQQGTIVVDGTYVGLGQSLGTDKVLGSASVFYLGGIPPAIPHTSATGWPYPSAIMTGASFAGCLFGVTLNGNGLSLSAQADPHPGVGLPQQGCPVNLVKGMAFLGGGYLAPVLGDQWGTYWEIQLSIRTTDSEGVLLSMLGVGDFLLAQLQNSSIVLSVYIGEDAAETLPLGSNLCDGHWHTVLLEQVQGTISITVDNLWTESLSTAVVPVLNTEVYFGGFPNTSSGYSWVQQLGVNTATPYSGCLVPSVVLNSTSVQLQVASSQFVRFDGCSGDPVLPRSTCSSPVTSISTLLQTSLTDNGLDSFTEYLYSITAMNSAGSVDSLWTPAFTQEGAPSGLLSPRVVAATSTSITVAWQPPSRTNGLVTSYSVVATPISTVGLSSPAGIPQTALLSVQSPEMMLEAAVSGLQPATTYLVSVIASTSVAQGASPAVTAHTSESVPSGVLPPAVISATSRSLYLEWRPPAQPNGVITLYNLFLGNTLSFSGLNTSFIVTGLSPYQQYTLTLQACTLIGCASSPSVTNQTLPDSPQGLAAPSLVALGPTSVSASWQPPSVPNGAILSYSLLRLSGPGLTQATVVFSGAGLQATVSGLSPATIYFFQLVAYNAGGSTQSSVSNVTTIESSPDGVPAPNVTVINSTALTISWSPPLVPNGVVTSYVLVQNGTNITSGFLFSYVSANLAPFTTYSYSVQACTIRGCGSSTNTLAVTAEAPPLGYVAPIIGGNVTSSSFVVTINSVIIPNGIVSYILYVSGLFLSVDGQLPNTTRTTVAYNSTVISNGVVVGGLLPYTQYQLWLVAANSAGSLQGAPLTVQTGIGAPQGQGVPTLSLLTTTSVLAQWSPPLLPGGPSLSYNVTVISAADSRVVSSGQNTTVIVRNLLPYNRYSVYITAANAAGNTTGPSGNITSGETAPDGFDAVTAQAIGPTYVVVSWSLPAHSNGVLVNFSVYSNGVLVTTVAPDVFSFNVTGLLPFTSYLFSAMVCTKVGCATGANKTVTTAEDVPSGMSAPQLMYVTVEVSGYILVLWGSPGTPNGIITGYTVERSTEGGDFSVVKTVLVPAFPSYLDMQTMPFTDYCYRITAANRVGNTTGPTECLLTPEAAPEGLQPLTTSNPTSSTIQIYFSAPLVPNGIISLYELARTDQDGTVVSIALNTSALPSQGDQYVYVATALMPYTVYNFSLTVCTGGGCSTTPTTSLQTLQAAPIGLTPPTAVAAGSSVANVSWTALSRPNGLLRSYTLLRYTLGFQNMSYALVPTCCDQYAVGGALSTKCAVVAQLPPTAMSYKDQGLYPYSYYLYCLVAANDVGNSTSGFSMAILMQPAPKPLSGPALNCTAINSTAIATTWSMSDVAQLLGPLQEYVLYGSPIQAWPGDVLFRGLAQNFVVTGLMPSTTYYFTISVSNGFGVTFGNNASTITSEGVPTNLSAPVITPISGTSLSVTWTTPAQPNGFIVSYTIYINNAANQILAAPGSTLVTGLQPFTQYSVRVGACTQFGCTSSSAVQATTLESPPDGIATPIVIVTGSTSVVVTWGPPQQPNGVILGYQLLQRTEVGTCMPPCYAQVEVFNGLAYQYNVTGLLPFTIYGYEVIPYNSAGNVSSGFTTAKTWSATPGGFGSPTVLSLSSSSISIVWSSPAQPSGVLLPYLVYRNGTLLTNTTSLTYLDSQLSPYTTYAYAVLACTSAGCTAPVPVVNTTFESLPQGVSSPNISNLLPTSMQVTWAKPTTPNGVILAYVLTLADNGTTLFSGIGLFVQLNNLQPFTNYSLTLSVCNSIGCTASSTTSARTPEAPPQSLDPPTARNLSSTSLALSWQAPATPNGIVTSYTLLVLNGTVWVTIFQGYGFTYTAMGLTPYTSYYYKVAAANGAGSVESSVTLAHTSPDLPSGLAAPVLSSISATSFKVTWSQPTLPNGVVLGYNLYINGIPALTGTLVFQYTPTGLLPYTSYTLYVEVCNQVGCSSSVSTVITTPQAPAQGLAPPLLVPLNATAITVTWSAPSQPNGVVTQYQVHRRLLGLISSETIQYVGSTLTFTFTNIGLQPYTSYQYRIIVINGGGAGYSDWNTTQTFQSAPVGMGVPTIISSDVYARNVTASWAPPTQPNGVITSYLFYYRLFDPLANGFGSSTLAATVVASVTTATATGLQPATIYEFSVAAVNSGGQTQGGWTMATTKQDAPEKVSSITIQSQTSTSFTLTWFPPTKPNGVISLYTVYISDQVSYQGTSTTCFVQGFSPFTSYMAVLSACTLAGCTNGTAQTITTSEGQPLGQGSPTVNATGPRSVVVMWLPPAQANGIIVQYQVFRQVVGNPLTLTVVLTTADTLTLRYVDTDVNPNTLYQYAVGVSNSAAQMVSSYVNVVTPEAAPQGVGAPTLTALSSSRVQVTWLAPTQPNGAILSYLVFRSGGGASNVSVYVGLGLNVSDTGLTPYTAYTYTVQACTFPGCSTSQGASVTTSEAPPVGVGVPTLLPLSSTVVGISWSSPSTPNGLIVQYLVNIQPVSILITTAKTAVNVTNLAPYTLYTVTLTACTSAGCTAGNPGAVLTLESTPGGMQPPQVAALSPTSVVVSWNPPSIPNGVITRYRLRRTGLDGTVSVDVGGSNSTFLDTSLSPVHTYSYSLQAFTSVGGGDFSPSQSITTPSDTPQNITSPSLLVLNSSSILAQWTPPGIPNGIIQNYSLFVNGLDVFTGLGTRFVVTGLSPYTQYTFALLACTTTCASSPASSVVTSESPPTGLAAPQLYGFANTTVLITWQLPSQPNGVIRSYTVLRSTFGGNLFSVVFAGLALTYRDTDPTLVPATRYEYQVVAINGAGNVSSPLAILLLPEAPPKLIPAPLFQNVAATSMLVLASPPSLPNGVLTLYQLYLNGLLWNSSSAILSSSVMFSVTALDPYTSYTFQLEACNSAGCGKGPTSSVTTGEATPGSLGQPFAASVSDQSITVQWYPPTPANGLIRNYTLWYKVPCPQPAQPSFLNLPACTVSSLVLLAVVPGTQLTYTFAAFNYTSHPLPYTSYQFQIRAANGVGSVTSDLSSSITTLTSAPLVLLGNFFITSVDGVVSFDWTSAFQYNGPVHYFSLTRNGTVIAQLEATQYTSTVEPAGLVDYVVTVTTDVGDASTPAYRILITSPSTTQTVTTLTTATVVQSTAGYSQPALVIGIIALVVFIVALIFILILCCMRPRGNAADIRAFKGFGQTLRPVSIESSGYSQFINQDLMQSRMDGSIVQDQVHAMRKEQYLHDFDQSHTGLDSSRQSWSPQHGDWEKEELKDTPIELRNSILLSETGSLQKEDMFELQDTSIRPLSEQFSETSDSSEPIRDTHISIRHSLSPSVNSEDLKNRQSVHFYDTRV